MADQKSVVYVTIGCRLPNGYTLEVGLQTTVKEPMANGGTAIVARLEQLPHYQKLTLKGTNEPIRQGMRQGFLLPSRLRPEPFYNRNVPKDFWEQWKKEHPKNGALKRGDIFEVPNGEANERAATLDMASAPAAPLQPMEQGKFVVGDQEINKAEFDKD